MKNLIKKYAQENKISDIGFLKADIYSDFLSPDNSPPFVNAQHNERINPFLLMENAKTIIVLLCSYNTGVKGNLSAYAMGLDYHIVMKNKAQPILELLISNGFKADFFCDNAPLNERFLANRAGLGFIGKNGFLISPKYGSFVFLAHIITDCEIEPDSLLSTSCNNCGKCISACPTNALATGDFYSCLSYITQKKGELSDHEKNLIKENSTCWGCDICQSVCPHNKNAAKTNIPEFSENLICNLNNLSMSNKEFKKAFSDRAFSWRGKKVIERNLNIINN